MKLDKAFIERHLPPIVFTGVDDEPGIFNTPITLKGKFQPEKIKINTYPNNVKIEPVLCKHKTTSNKNEV
jgi:hypothetical protein